MSQRRPYMDLSRHGKYKRRKSRRVEIPDETCNDESPENVDLGCHNVRLVENYEDQSRLIPNLAHCPSDLNDGPSNFLFDLSSDDVRDNIGVFQNVTETNLLKEELRNWAIRFNINHVALSALLAILHLHSCFLSFPLDAMTLMKTPRDVSIIAVEPGSYGHIGLGYCLRIMWNSIKEFSHVDLLFNVDGLPLFKGSFTELWPILGTITNVPRLRSAVFPIGVFCGRGKPSCCFSFFKCFVD